MLDVDDGAVLGALAQRMAVAAMVGTEHADALRQQIPDDFLKLQPAFAEAVGNHHAFSGAFCFVKTAADRAAAHCGQVEFREVR